ncbi:MAG TPA: hypothetical protein VK489_05725 [Ferruginibacter sp.]|nr:hypothetical protein [Ferruginibacter sp.]
MKKLFPVFFAVTVLIVFSCTKEYSLENGDNSDNSQIVGVDCRITKISYTDTATDVGIGSLSAEINSTDDATVITLFDSLSSTIAYRSMPVHSNDTIFINSNEYFVTDPATKRIKRLHALVDPTDLSSVQYDVDYFYNASNFLTSKFYSYTSNPGTPFRLVTYTYSGENIIGMSATDLASGDLETDAVINYYTNILPKRYIYVFPDETNYSFFTQFYNFGQKPSHAIKDMKVRYYDPGNVARDSSVSTFTNYMISRDNYVLSVFMNGDDQPSIPAAAGLLNFSYKCK